MPRKSASSGAASSRHATSRHTTPDAALRELRAFGLSYPKAHTKSPWPGHLDLAVNDKTFAYLGLEGEPFSIGCKLPHSSAMALNLPFTQPTPYGLGRSGWVTASPPAGRPIPVELFKAWIDESYRAQAPKKLLALLPPSASGAVDAAPAARPAARRGEKTAARSGKSAEAPAARPAKSGTAPRRRSKRAPSP